jgi:uncharacterized membrane protein
MIKYLTKRQYTIVDLIGQLFIAWLITTQNNWWYVGLVIPLGLLSAFLDSVEKVTRDGFHK